MADNVAITAGTGTSIAADDVSSVFYQKVRIDWTDDAGASHTRSETLKFPNFLQSVGAEDLKEWLTELMLREARQRLGVDA